ncbi:MAG: hypothetical protein JWN68_3539 [Nocardioides sp.]|jgi:hypothetical protein|uniref:hypothetical protein n=1 Tax=Nocardioides sp. TaxID=35761 RepID=UPI00263437EB|nr:hypothetical protein [Nocardioides sp.]MCW2835586.1 hypothetical protein [Nocardioides sp.]
MTDNLIAPTEQGLPNGRYVVGGAVAACAVCCAPPVLALVGIAGSGALATGATFAFAGLTFAIVVAAITVGAFMTRRRTRDGPSRRPPRLVCR